jgi:hypothetical protein
MSTTTDGGGGPSARARYARPWRRWLGGAGLALSGWLILASLVTAALEPTPLVLVIGPAARSLGASLEAGVRLVDAGPGYLVVAGDRPGFVAALYAGGALLVLPRRGGGCGRMEG